MRQVWIGPRALGLLGLPDTFTPPAGREDGFRAGVPHPWTDALAADGWQLSTSPAGLNPWIGAGKDGAWLDLIFPSWDAGNPFAGATSAAALLRALEAFAGAVGLRYRRSPQTTGLALLRDLHRDTGWPEAHLPPPALAPPDGEAPGSYLAEALPGAGYLHAYDLNGMYLAACSVSELGYGEPIHLDGPEVIPDGPAGYYRAAITPPAGDLPPLPFLADGSPRWYPHPALRLALDLGCRADLVEAWVYPAEGRWLRPFYERLRDARIALAGSPLAAGAVKAVYTRTLGRLAASWLGEGEDTFRPDWRDSVIARARANMYRHLSAIQRHSGALPIALDADTAIYASGEADPVSAGALLGVELADQLGKWKPAGSLTAATARKRTAGLKTSRRRLSALLSALRAPNGR